MENYVAVKEFFKAFPDFSNHSVYIMGESYAGIYVPTLTALIIQGRDEFPINLKVSSHHFAFSSHFVECFPFINL